MSPKTQDGGTISDSTSPLSAVLEVSPSRVAHVRKDERKPKNRRTVILSRNYQRRLERLEQHKLTVAEIALIEEESNQ